MDIVVWLRSLGLGKYEAAFRDDEIDETVLPDLTAEDLKELGVTALGHCRKLLAAIAALSGKKPLASLLIGQGERRGEPLDDPALLFSNLYDLWVANYAAFNGDILCRLAKKFLALAEKKGMADPLMIGHWLMGVSLVATGNITEGRAHLDRAFALYNHTAHASLASRPRRAGVDLVVSVAGAMVAGLSRSRTGRRKARSHARTRNPTSPRIDVCTILYILCDDLLRILPNGKIAAG
jgi:hypothetical protein